MQISQEYGRSPVCLRLCFIRSYLLPTFLLHTSQETYWSHTFLFLWFSNCSSVGNLFLQVLQENFQCFLLCDSRDSMSEYTLWQTSQENVLLLRWRSLCLSKSNVEPNLSLQISQLYGLRICDSLCTLSCWFEWKDLSHLSHE